MRTPGSSPPSVDMPRRSRPGSHRRRALSVVTAGRRGLHVGILGRSPSAGQPRVASSSRRPLPASMNMSEHLPLGGSQSESWRGTPTVSGDCLTVGPGAERSAADGRDAWVARLEARARALIPTILCRLRFCSIKAAPLMITGGCRERPLGWVRARRRPRSTRSAYAKPTWETECRRGTRWCSPAVLRAARTTSR